MPAGLRLGALDASDAASGGASQAIDVRQLTAGGTTKITLPVGAVGSTYALTLQLTGCAATDTFTWAGDSTDATGRATITPSGDTNQTALFSLTNLSSSDVGQHLLVTVDLKNTSATPQVTYTLQFDIAVGQFDALSLTPPVLMPVVVGTAYTQDPGGARREWSLHLGGRYLGAAARPDVGCQQPPARRDRDRCQPGEQGLSSRGDARGARRAHGPADRVTRHHRAGGARGGQRHAALGKDPDLQRGGQRHGPGADRRVRHQPLQTGQSHCQDGRNGKDG